MGISSTIAKKVTMALSGLFLVIFLLLHVSVNMLSVISPEAFNTASQFMGYNIMVQWLLQPILAIGVVVHFVMGFVVQIRNNGARKIGYVKYNGQSNSSWMSRNMIWSGLVILAFFGLHFYDFWFPELIHKYVESNPMDPSRFYGETVAKFAGDPIRTGLYVISFVFLGLHLWHGFASSFQSMGIKHDYSKKLKHFTWTKAFSIIVPLGFIFIALFHYFNN